MLLLLLWLILQMVLMMMMLMMMMMHAHVQLIMIIHIMVVMIMIIIMMIMIIMTIISGTAYMAHTVLLWQSLAFILTTISNSGIIMISGSGHVILIMIGIHVACTAITAFIRVIACVEHLILRSILMMIMGDR